MTKKQSIKKSNQPKAIKLSNEQIETICKELVDSDLNDITRELVVGLIKTNKWLIEKLEQGKISIQKLRKIFGVTTEKNSKYQDRKDKANATNKESHAPQPGHGRNHSDELTLRKSIIFTQIYQLIHRCYIRSY